MKLSAPQLVFLSLSLVGSALTLRASPQVAVPTGRIPQFENDEVKVWKSVVAPGSPLPLHRHEHPRVIIALVGGTMKIVQQGGVSDTYEWQSGKSYWLPANPPGTLHTDVNTGDKPIEVMVVELKKAH
jgi:quercetin dioxygenase-like cupin family protein